MSSSRRPVARSILFVALTTAAASAAAAPPVFEEEITITATGREEAVGEVPVPISVIGRAELDDAQADTVADLLRRQPGLTVTRSGAEGSVTSLFTRGTESDHTLVLYDGVRMNSPYFAGFDWSTAPTAGLERIEVARGPFSALWGADAVGGVVQLIPRRAEPGLAGGLLLEGGADSWRRAEAAVAWGAERFELAVSGSARDGGGELANDDFSTRQLLVDAGWRWGEGNRVGLLVQRVDAEVGIPFSGATPTPFARQTSRSSLVALPLRWTVAEGWELEASAAVVVGELGYADPDDPFGFTESNTDTTGLQTRLAAHHTIGSHALTVGGEWRRDEVDDRSSYGVNLDNASSDVSGVFVQDVWRPSRRVQVVAGLRWDDAEAWGSEVSPRLALGLALGDRVELRAGYGEAYRQPAVGELYFPFLGNPDLRPELSRSAELGLASRGRGPVAWQVSAFATELDDLIEYDFTVNRFANVRSATIHGVEAGLEAALGAGLVGAAQLTWLDTEGDGGLPLLRRPEWSGSVTLRGQLAARLRGDLTALWVGSRDDVDPASFERTTTGGFVTADLALAYRLTRAAEATVRVVNLADRAYQAVLGYPAPGRRLVAGIRLGRRG